MKINTDFGDFSKLPAVQQEGVFDTLMMWQEGSITNRILLLKAVKDITGWDFHQTRDYLAQVLPVGFGGEPLAPHWEVGGREARIKDKIEQIESLLAEVKSMLLK